MGDFCEVAYEVLEKRLTGSAATPLSLAQVNDALDAIAQSHADKQPAEKKERLRRLVRCASANENKWLVCILLKDLRCGAGLTGALYASATFSSHTCC